MKSWAKTVSIVAALAGQFLLAEEIVSPFIPPPRTSAAGALVQASPLDDLEFTGIVKIGGRVELSLYNPKTKKSYRVSETKMAEEGIRLVEFELGKSREQNVIVIQQGEHTKRIAMKEETIVSLKQPTPRAAPPSQPQGIAPGEAVRGQPGQQPMRPGPAQNIQAASDEEVRIRMQRVAEEIRRRRATRMDLIEEGGGSRTGQ